MFNIDMYAKHSKLSMIEDISLIDELPSTPSELFKLAQNLFVHENECQWANYSFAKPRYTEANLRKASEMIQIIRGLSNKKICANRSVEEKVISSCRGASLLFTSFLRARNIPARLNIGFVTYHPIAKFNMDHVVVEYFYEGQWKLADVLMTESFIRMNKKATMIDPMNLQGRDFIPAAQAWRKVRTHELSATEFGIGLFHSRRGLFAIRNKLMHALAASLKIEMLPGDLWGYMLFDGPTVAPENHSQLSCMDRLADVLIEDNLTQCHRLYTTDPALRVPSIVINHSGVQGHTACDIGDVYAIND